MEKGSPGFSVPLNHSSPGAQRPATPGWPPALFFSGAITRPQVPQATKANGSTQGDTSAFSQGPAAKRQRLLSVTTIPTQVNFERLSVHSTRSDLQHGSSEVLDTKYHEVERQAAGDTTDNSKGQSASGTSDLTHQHQHHLPTYLTSQEPAATAAVTSLTGSGAMFGHAGNQASLYQHPQQQRWTSGPLLRTAMLGTAEPPYHQQKGPPSASGAEGSCSGALGERIVAAHSSSRDTRSTSATCERPNAVSNDDHETRQTTSPQVLPASFEFCLAEAQRLNLMRDTSDPLKALLQNPKEFIAQATSTLGTSENVERNTALDELQQKVRVLCSATAFTMDASCTPSSGKHTTTGKVYTSWPHFYEELKHHRLSKLKSTSCPSLPWVAVPGSSAPPNDRMSDIRQVTDSHHNRRLARLISFQTYLRTQITTFHSFLPIELGRPIDDPRSSILTHLPPQHALSVHDARKSKLLSRLRVEGHDRHREHEDKRRQRAEFLKDVMRQRARFTDAHARSGKSIKRITHAVTKYFSGREKKDASAEQQQFSKERLAALRARDEVQYMKLLREAKNQRLLELVRQTEEYMNKLGALVTLQRESELQQEGKSTQLLNAAASTPVSDPPPEGDSYDALLAAKNRYFTLTHTVQEEIVAAPKILKGGTLREYQLKGLSWLVSLYNNNLNGILADAMGLGKTIQTIALLGYLYEVKRNKGPFLIVAPLSTLHSGWDAELKTWLPSFVKVVYDGSKESRKALRQKYFGDHPSFNVLLTTDAFIMRDCAHLRKIRWEYLIVDEAHRLKNPKSKLAQILADKRHGVGFKIRRRLALTGTPLQNDLQEVWALLNFLMPRIFSSSETFRSWFNAPLSQAGPQHQVDMTEEEQLLVVDRLHKVLRPFLLRREKKEVENEVPQKHEEVLWCPLSGVQRGLYQQIESGDTSGTAASSNTLMQLRKVCNHPYLFCPKTAVGPEFPTDESIVRVCGKFWVLDDILTKLYATHHRVLIFSQMVRLLNVLEVFLSMRGWQFLRLDGGTSSEERLHRLQLFNAPNSPYFVFALSTKAGGLGVNLQSADTVIIYDSDWNPQNDEQAQSRAHRIGQTREVLILRLVTPDTVEERILAAAGVKLDKDALIIKSGMFYDSGYDLEDERRNRVRAILSKRGQRQAVTFFEHGAVNRQLARNEKELEIFMRMDRQRRVLGHGDLIEEVILPPCLMKPAKSQQALADWNHAYSSKYPWKTSDPAKPTQPAVIAQKENCINQAILQALSDLQAEGKAYRLRPGDLLPFMDVPDANEFPTYKDIVSQPMCLNYIRSFAKNGNFSSLLQLEKYLARIASNCRLFNGPDHFLFHQALRVMYAIMSHVRHTCCLKFAEIEYHAGQKTQQDVDRIHKTLMLLHGPSSGSGSTDGKAALTTSDLYVDEDDDLDDEEDEKGSDVTENQGSLLDTLPNESQPTSDAEATETDTAASPTASDPPRVTIRLASSKH